MNDEQIKMCNDCKWIEWNWFVAASNRKCKHPIEIKHEMKVSPAGNGRPFVAIARSYGICGRTGKLWNTDKDGNANN